MPSLKNIGEDTKEYLIDLIGDIEDWIKEFRENLFRNPFKRPRKIHRKMKKRVRKHGRPALSLAERIRGVVYLIVSIGIISAAVIAVTDGVTGVSEMLSYLIQNWTGRIILFFIGIAYLIYGIWKIIMGSD